MTGLRWYALPAAGLLTLGGACASQQRTSDNPVAQQVQSNQEASQQALNRAHEAQQKATDQAQQVASDQQHVQDLQRQLQESQQKLRQDQAKARQLQDEATRQTEQSSRVAQQAQQQASSSLERQGQLVQRNQQLVKGQVTQASPDRIEVTPRGGNPMSFRLTDQTQVQIDGRMASGSDIKQGEDALVSYSVSGTQPMARSVQIVTGDVGRLQPESSGAAPLGMPPARDQSQYGSPSGTGTSTPSDIGTSGTGSSTDTSGSSASPPASGSRGY